MQHDEIINMSSNSMLCTVDNLVCHTPIIWVNGIPETHEVVADFFLELKGSLQYSVKDFLQLRREDGFTFLKDDLLTIKAGIYHG